MFRFSTLDLMDETKYYEFLVEILHPSGLCCPSCGRNLGRLKTGFSASRFLDHSFRRDIYQVA